MYHKTTIPEDYATYIADLLTEHAGARLGTDTLYHRLDRHSFVSYLGESTSVEWRFQGALGFGGKFRSHGNGWRIDCYREDETPARNAMIDQVNTKLADLYNRFLLGMPAKRE